MSVHRHALAIASISALSIVGFAPTRASIDTTGQGSPVAIVTHVVCAPKQCVIVRGSHSALARPMTTLLVGDVVEARGGTVEIAMADRHSLIVTGAHGRQTILEPASESGVLRKFFDGFTSQFAPQKFSESSASARGAALHSGSRPHCVPQLLDEAVLVAEGTRSLSVPVATGADASRIRIVDQSGNAIAQSTNSGSANQSLNVLTVSVLLDHTAAAIVLLGADDRETARIQLHVVAQSLVPKPPTDLTVAGASANGALALQLAWLLQTENGAWSIEAVTEAEEAGESGLASSLAEKCGK